MKNLKLFFSVMSAVLFGFSLLLSTQNASAQAVSINSSGLAPDASSILDISSSTKGILIPRVALNDATTAAPITSPATGLMIYNSTGTEPNGFYFWNGTSWNLLYSGSVPSVPGNTEYWLRPTAAAYIFPEHNAQIKVYDAGQTYGLFYDGGTNQYGLYGRTTNVIDPTAAVVGFSDVTGNQTYGYLGFNGTYTPPTAGFGTINGAAVYGVVDDPGRISGFFRTTGNASYAANIGYSDVWIPGFFYGDDISTAYNGRPAVYASMKTAVDKAGNQIGAWGRAEYTAATTANLGSTIGGYFQGIGNNQDAYGIYSFASCTGSAKGVGVYAQSSGNLTGSDYYSNNVGAIEGDGAWNSTQYNFGVVGRMAGSGTRSGGVMGTYWTSDWGALGYLKSNGIAYGVVYVGGATTSGKNGTSIQSSVGIGGNGALMGSWTKGEVYGMAVSGDRYSLYVEGKQFTNDVITQMNNNGTEQRFATFVPTSMTADIYMKGTGKLINGKATIEFNKNYLNIISAKTPVIVTVTPTGKSTGLYIESIKKDGFSVAENNNSESSVGFTWIAVATRKGYETPEIPAELLAKSYDSNLAKFMTSENNTSETALPMWWDGNELHFSELPEGELHNKKGIIVRGSIEEGSVTKK